MLTIKNNCINIILYLPRGQGIEPGGWPTQNKAAWLDEDAYIKAAQLAEQAKLDGFFIADTPGITLDISRQPLHHGLGPLVARRLLFINHLHHQFTTS